MALRARSVAVPLLALAAAAAGAVDASAQPGPGEGTGPPPRPTASFVFSPANPVAGETVTFTSTSEASEGSITDVDWDFDGDGEFDDFEGSPATWSFATPGVHTVQLRVRQTNGRHDTTFADVTVAAAAPPPPAPAPDGALQSISPFPVIRIAGTVLPRGALVRILSVRGPRGMRVRALCHGSGCPVRVVARTATTRLVRIRRLERRLRAGITLELFVRRSGKIGKYTRFRIRAGKTPARIDRCLLPGRTRPVPCP